MRPFKRIPVTDARHFINLIKCIHLNPTRSGLCSTASAWMYSSYNSIINGDTKIVRASEVVNVFDDISNFKHAHAFDEDFPDIEELIR